MMKRKNGIYVDGRVSYYKHKLLLYMRGLPFFIFAVPRSSSIVCKESSLANSGLFNKNSFGRNLSK